MQKNEVPSPAGQTARTSKERFRSKHTPVLEWSSQSPDCSPTNLTCPLFWKDECAEILVSRYVKLVEKYTKSFHFIVKGDFAKHSFR